MIRVPVIQQYEYYKTDLLSVILFFTFVSFSIFLWKLLFPFLKIITCLTQFNSPGREKFNSFLSLIFLYCHKFALDILIVYFLYLLGYSQFWWKIFVSAYNMLQIKFILLPWYNECNLQINLDVEGKRKRDWRTKRRRKTWGWNTLLLMQSPKEADTLGLKKE